VSPAVELLVRRTIVEVRHVQVLTGSRVRACLG